MSVTTEDIIGDIYRFLSESEEVDYEELQNELIEIAENPINLNTASYDDLARLRFLSPRQIDNILLYVYRHNMENVSELRLVGGLQDYEIRDMLPFVCVLPAKREEPVYWREMFRFARHELTARTDVRYAEEPQRDKQTDPVFTQFRYRGGFHDKWQVGLALRRPTGGGAETLQYGGYVQIGSIKHLHTLVLGNYQAQFGQGLVTAYPYHTGKSAYIQHVGSVTEGLRKYSSVDGNALHGVGATVRWEHVDVSAWYSLEKDNMQIHRHVVGSNVTMRYGDFKVGLTVVENIWSDSVRYYFENAAYNQNYFRGNRQFVGGANFRWHKKMATVFGELATAQNKGSWGVGAFAGVELSMKSDVDLTFAYRYYSPKFENTLGYAFSETSRANDENGLYAGAVIHCLAHWRFAVYGDIFRFAGIKYGIPYSPSWGYDTRADITWLHGEDAQIMCRLRAREKAKVGTYSCRLQGDWRSGKWHLRTVADANMVNDSVQAKTWGVSVLQDVEYKFSRLPLVMQMRVQGFRVKEWQNRIYVYENDVLYGWSAPAMYGTGVRMYLNMRWQIIRQLAVYLRVSETIYGKEWIESRGMANRTRTDVHLLLRVVL